MHFIKAAISLFTLASFAMAQHDRSGLEAREAYQQYLAERNEYEYHMERDLATRGPKYQCIFSHIHDGYQCALYGVTPKCPCSKAKRGQACKC
ncbi:unnamed protein product [Clonostachys rosea f. rosea IK726]|uniref:Uncharacterized protein n=2 Tax=Bionectria ochroleuca TaxID=29856 RepID=A0A0B7KI80_BIOOC|nr:unnamed protein product [Clonostachys rosea f. rosea IK726]